MKTNKNKKKFLFNLILTSQEVGYSTNEMLVTIALVGILATLIIPNFTPALEFIEVLIAEKYLLNAVKECQLDIVNFEPNPQYTLTMNEISLGIFRKNKYIISHTGIMEDCLPALGGNTLRVTKVSQTKGSSSYSLSINVVSGQKSYEGVLPDWLDWWNGKHSPIIPEGDSYFLR